MPAASKATERGEPFQFNGKGLPVCFKVISLQDDRIFQDEQDFDLVHLKIPLLFYKLFLFLIFLC